MVVFENGKPKKSHYRRFKIKTVEGPNDFASLQEVIKRRFVSSGLIGSAVEDIDDNLSTKGILLKDARSKAKYQNMAVKKDISFNTKPDLILIDGGKGQLSAVAEIMRVDLGLYNIPIASIAKKREEIFILDSSESIMLPRNSVGLYLIQQLRDEAHRFAITFHRKLRDNRTFISELDLIPGIGPQKKKSLLNYFGSLKNIKKASLNDLVKVPGINARLALIIREYV
jgi:excinuclease ABC subunit C